MELLLEKNYQLKKRAEVLGILPRIPFVLQLLEPMVDNNIKYSRSYFMNVVLMLPFIGGIVENYNSNLIGKNSYSCRSR
jgi:hypothetical protein